MKKVLFATTALIASAGMAAADVTIGGMGRFGVVKVEGADATIDNRTQFDLRGAGETEGGLSFGGHIRMRSTSGTATLNAGRVFISSGGLTVHAGNIPGPIESLANVYHTVGYSGGTFQATVSDGDTMAYSSTGTGAQGIQADYAMGDVTTKVAYQPSTENFQISLEYSAGALTLGAAAQISDVDASDVTVVTLGYDFGTADIALAYGDNNGTTETVGSIRTSIGAATSLAAYVGDRDGAADTGYGIGLTYDLGGATLGAAYEGTYAGTSRFEAGISFAF